MSTATYDSYITRLQNAWRAEDDEEHEHAKHREIPDGTVIRVPMLALDEMQRDIAGHTVDQRIRDNRRANQAALDAARREADRVQAFADHFTAQREQREREARDENRAYSAYCEALSNGWQNPQVAA
jgi:hypothetical protein